MFDKLFKDKLTCSSCGKKYVANTRCICQTGKKIKYVATSIFADLEAEKRALEILKRKHYGG